MRSFVLAALVAALVIGVSADFNEVYLSITPNQDCSGKAFATLLLFNCTGQCLRNVLLDDGVDPAYYSCSPGSGSQTVQFLCSSDCSQCEASTSVSNGTCSDDFGAMVYVGPNNVHVPMPMPGPQGAAQLTWSSFDDDQCSSFNENMTWTSFTCIPAEEEKKSARPVRNAQSLASKIFRRGTASPPNDPESAALGCSADKQTAFITVCYGTTCNQECVSQYFVTNTCMPFTPDGDAAGIAYCA